MALLSLKSSRKKTLQSTEKFFKERFVVCIKQQELLLQILCVFKTVVPLNVSVSFESKNKCCFNSSSFHTFDKNKLHYVPKPRRALSV